MTVDDRFRLPIIYVRGFVPASADSTVDDPFYGFNAGSTHVRQDGTGQVQFFAFEGALVRLMSDYGYDDAYQVGVQLRPSSSSAPRPDGSPAPPPDGGLVVRSAPLRVGLARGEEDDQERPVRSVWIYRYYDDAVTTFATTSGRRQEIEASAAGLAELIAHVKRVTGAPRVLLVGHSTGGLIIRSLLQRTYPAQDVEPTDHVDKVFTYATPHGGIHFSGGALGWAGELLGDVVEAARDALGRLLPQTNIDDFGLRRMAAYLAPDGDGLPGDWTPRDPPSTFPVERIFCLVGTNAGDYNVAQHPVGVRSDGLVQIEAAYLKGAPRAYAHRSHSGRYGIVNSEEGYQNLERFLFGDLQVQVELAGLTKVQPQSEQDLEDGVVYLVDTTVSVRGLPALMHDQQIQHNSGVAVEQRKLEMGEPIPLFRAFLSTGKTSTETVRYAIRLQVHEVRMRRGRQVFGAHVEQIPRWQDILVCDLTADKRLHAMWVSDHPDWQGPAPGEEVVREPGSAFAVALPASGKAVLGRDAALRFLPFDWNYWWDTPGETPLEREALTRLDPVLRQRLWAGRR